MPRDASGNYYLPANALAIANSTASSTYFNNGLNDIAAALTGSVPRDGTGGMSAPLKGVNGSASAPAFGFTSSPNTGLYYDGTSLGLTISGTLVAKMGTSGWQDASGNPYLLAQTWGSIASASTTDLSTVSADSIFVTGTTTITSFGVVASGRIKTLRFAGALTLTYNATSLILPGAANITTAANDVAVFASLGGGNWVCIGYQISSAPANIYPTGTAANNILKLDSSGAFPGVTTVRAQSSVPTTSGTNIDITSIPAWIKRLTVMFYGVSTNGTNSILLQAGAGSVQTSGYNCMVSAVGSGVTSASFTNGFAINISQAAAASAYGSLTLSNAGSNYWVANGSISNTAATTTFTIAGGTNFSGTVDRIRLTTNGGTDAFDGGFITVSWE